MNTKQLLFFVLLFIIFQYNIINAIGMDDSELEKTSPDIFVASDTSEQSSEEKNLCRLCHRDMGPNNPRPNCGKRDCSKTPGEKIGGRDLSVCFDENGEFIPKDDTEGGDAVFSISLEVLNRCRTCGIDMGADNPRQLCQGLSCPYPWFFKLWLIREKNKRQKTLSPHLETVGLFVMET